MNEPSTHGIQIEISPHDQHELLQRQPRDRMLTHRCYLTAQEHPAVCHRCSAIRVLIAKGSDGQPICGPCAGSRFDYRSSKCGIAGRVYTAGNRYRCCVEIRLPALLGGGQGPIPGHLTPLADALLAAEKPRSVLVWLGRSPAAQLLAQLAAQENALTHVVLDSLPPSRAVHFVRRMLIDTGVLPDRLENLDRIVPWLDAQLEPRPATHARLVRPYVQWHLLHRARRRAQSRGDSGGAAHRLRETIRVTLNFLVWLDERAIDLPALTQHHVDSWLTEPIWSHRRYLARDFLKWAASKRLAPGTSRSRPSRPVNPKPSPIRRTTRSSCTVACTMKTSRRTSAPPVR